MEKIIHPIRCTSKERETIKRLNYRLKRKVALPVSEIYINALRAYLDNLQNNLIK
jgi:hypothetical protein